MTFSKDWIVHITVADPETLEDLDLTGATIKLVSLMVGATITLVSPTVLQIYFDDEATISEGEAQK